MAYNSYKCVIAGCRNEYYPGSGISFFSFHAWEVITASQIKEKAAMSNPPKKPPKKRKPKASSEGNDDIPPEKKKKPRQKPSEGIEMSKKLAEKYKNRRPTHRSCSKKNNEPRLCGNGKPMPSLAELEKMFEDSDTDEERPETQNNNSIPQKCKTPEPLESPLIISEEKLTSPSTLQKIVSKVIKRIEELPSIDLVDDDEPPPPVIPPPKRKKPKQPHIVGCKEREQVPWAPKTSFLVGDTKYGPEHNKCNNTDESDCETTKRCRRSKKLNISKSVFNAKSDEIAERLIEIERINPAPEQPTGIPGPPSPDSSDTVDYEITDKSPRPFSPLPSTSNDNNIIRMNDQLFNESLMSLRSTNNGSINNTIKSEDISYSSNDSNSVTNKNSDCKNLEDDEGIENLPLIDVDLSASASTSRDYGHNKTINKTDNDSLRNYDNDIEIIETPTETIVIDDTFTYTPKPKSSLNINDDECCIITAPAQIKPIPNNNDSDISFKDEIYGSIDLTSMETEPCEVIDIDDIIAESQAVINNIEKQRLSIDCVTLVEPNTSQNSGTLPENDITQNENITSTPNQSVETIISESNNSVQIIENTLESTDQNAPNTQPVPHSANDHNYSITNRELDSRPMQPLLNRSRRNNSNRRNRNRPYNILTNLFSYILPPQLTDQSVPSEPRELTPAQTQSNDPDPAMSSSGEARPSTRQIGDCPICMDSLSNGAIASTLCGHLFCMNCIKAAIRSSGKRCPTCRKVLKGATPYHQIFI